MVIGYRLSVIGWRLAGRGTHALLAAALCIGAGCVFAASAATNEMRAVPMDELVVRAQRFGSTEPKRADKAAARDELFRRGPEALRWLMAHSRIENVTVQGLALESVLRLKAEEGVPVLLDFLKADEPLVRKYAAYFLGFYQTPEHADRLTPLLADEEAAGAAIRTLGKWKVGAAVPAIVPFLKHTREIRRVAAANALRDIGDPAAADALIGALDDPMFTVRETAARALASFGREAERAMIRALPSADGQRKRALIRALGDMRADRASRALKRLRDDPDPDVRGDVQEALQRIAEPRKKPGA